MFVRSSDHDDN
jgi:hypothetical protein